VKDNLSWSEIVLTEMFQTPFGITACESQNARARVSEKSSFKRLSASLHVKDQCTRTFCVIDGCVSNAFRHHCM